MKSAIILDDEQPAINMLQSYLERFDFISVIDAFKSLDLAEHAIITHKPDLLFLDIRIKGQYVFSMLENLKTRHLSFSIIFVTGFYKEHLEDAINSCGFKYPFSYISKPIDISILQEKLSDFQLLNQTEPGISSNKEYLIVKQSKGFLRIRFNEIIYCESDGNYSNVFIWKNNKITRKNVQSSLRNMETQLPDHLFFRMSSKHLINVDYFDEVIVDGKNRSCLLRFDSRLDPKILPIPENKWPNFKRRLF